MSYNEAKHKQSHIYLARKSANFAMVQLVLHEEHKYVV